VDCGIVRGKNAASNMDVWEGLILKSDDPVRSLGDLED
jgi:hypothetical protein